MAVAHSASLFTHSGRAHGWLKFISVLTVLAVFALIILGGVVRVTGSGLGCPDWPLCYGK
ncbi:MAG TPA: COX15/CtaA family protein, partial [Dehalococcoidia bacterium]|nr:COX15/CtaA family protein [Dehalococcoidia bacterium]